MKKLLFGLIATVMFSISSYGNVTAEKLCLKNNEIENPLVKINKNDIPNCGDRGGLCAVHYTDANGNPRVFYACCGDLRIVKL